MAFIGTLAGIVTGILISKSRLGQPASTWPVVGSRMRWIGTMPSNVVGSDACIIITSSAGNPQDEEYEYALASNPLETQGSFFGSHMDAFKADGGVIVSC